jgi:hypothetical protein
MSSAPAKNSPGRPSKLKLDKRFQPCPLEEGDEAYPNGIFEFNITRLIAFIDAHPRHVPFLTSATAYEKYVDYWNSKVKEARSVRRSRAAWPPTDTPWD